MGSSDEVEIFKEKGKKGKRVLEGNYGEVKRQKRDNAATCGKKVRKSREKKFTRHYSWVWVGFCSDKLIPYSFSNT